MEIYQGTEGFGGVALGKIKYIDTSCPYEDNALCVRPVDETAKYEAARDRVLELLKREIDSDQSSLGENARWSSSPQSQQMLLLDHQLEDAIYGRILNNQCSAYEAIKGAGDYLTELLSGNDDSYIKNKSQDIKELTRKLTSCLEGYRGADLYLNEQVIITAKELSSSDFLKLDRQHIMGLMVEHSSSTSHMTIIAKAMGIPLILGCECLEQWDGKDAVLDGGWRVLYLDPDEATISDMKERIAEEKVQKEELSKIKGQECITSDGRSIHLYANICSISELKIVEDNDAEGIGLYRTEPGYVNRYDAPTEEELYNEYKSLAVAINPRPATIRTVDLGMDREIPFLHNKIDSNPALGNRGIRMSLRHPDIFKVQIRAILRAAVYGDLSMMFPMVTSIKELIAANNIVDECIRELKAESTPYKEVQIGVMIETPAAALISEEIAKHADFLSIGTNDLTQYALGVDRDNKELADVCDYHHPAILKMIRMIVEGGHKTHTPVGICGELASDEQLTGYFIELGVDSLSIAPSLILPLKNKILKY